MPKPDSALPLRPPGLVARDPIMRGEYLAPLLRLHADEQRYLSSGRLRRQYLEIAATYTSFVGRYAQAHAYADRGRMVRAQGAKGPSALPLEVVAYPAASALAREARGRRAVLVNEAHHVPQHRAFTLQLLRALRAEGFNVFAAEMVSPEDTLLAARGYPAAGRTGIYTDEPLGAELVREAFRLGFRVIAYDGLLPCEPRDDDPLFCANERERQQAEALAAVLAEDPQAQLVVHAGYGHVHEEASGTWVPMAVRLRELSGEDPLTVDQTVMTERSAPTLEHSWYREAEARRLLEGAVVLATGDGGWLVDGAAVDVQVFHPRTQLVDGRPQWLPSERRPLFIPVPPHDGPVLLQAFHAGEGRDAVPADQILVEPGETAPPLMLAPGEYRVVVQGRAGSLVPETKVRVEATEGPLADPRRN